MDDRSDYELKAVIEACRARTKRGLCDATLRQRADDATAELQRRLTPYIEALALDPCDPARYYGQPQEELAFRVFVLGLMEDWHDVYQTAVREERWFVQHFLNAAQRARLRSETANRGDATDQDGTPQA